MKPILVNKKRRTKFFNIRKGAIAFLGICVLISCHEKRFDSEKELWVYIKNPENGYHHQKVVGTIKYELTYRPTDILVKQELGRNTSKTAVDSLRKIYGDYLYFNLNLSANGHELLSSVSVNKNAFGSLVKQLSFNMRDKAQIITMSRDTLSLVDYNYSRLYGMSNSTNLLLVFARDEAILKEEYCHVTIEDFGLGTGDVSFKLFLHQLKKEPKLSFL
nr:hypothetical protein [Allomuricauda sp.]